MLQKFRSFLHSDSAGGIVLIIATLLALMAANSPLQAWYDQLLSLKVTVAVGNFEISKPLLLWINDGLMAIFFFLVGLELKREALIGDLNTPKKVMLPAFGAVGGMAVPALIFAGLNYDDSDALQGWAIPTATDIAFALGVLSLVGRKVPASLKIFLVSLAIFDDLGAIIIIALFYTDNLSASALIAAATGISLLFLINRLGIVTKAAYIMIGMIIWVSLLKSGVHATLAGVIVALFIPLRGTDWDDVKHEPLHEMESDLHGPVYFLILPVFAFANSGLSFAGLTLDSMFTNISIGIILGLFFGKQIGVLSFVWLGKKMNLGELSGDVSWRHLYGISVLCGVGFTMSLFIGSLAFEQGGSPEIIEDRLGILLGSFFSGIWGYLWLKFFAKQQPARSALNR